MLMCGKNHHSTGKQLSSNLKMYLKRLNKKKKKKKTEEKQRMLEDS